MEKKKEPFNWLQNLNRRYVFTRQPQRQQRHSRPYSEWLSETLIRSNIDEADKIKIWNHFKKYPQDYIRSLSRGGLQRSPQVAITEFLRAKRLRNLRQKYPNGIPGIKKQGARIKPFPINKKNKKIMIENH